MIKIEKVMSNINELFELFDKKHIHSFIKKELKSDKIESIKTYDVSSQNKLYDYVQMYNNVLKTYNSFIMREKEKLNN